MLWAIAAVAVVALVAGAVVVTGSGDDGPSAEEALDHAQAAMLDAGSFRMRSTSEDGSADFGTYRVVTEAEVSGADWHARADEDGYYEEAIELDGSLYIRSEEDPDALAETQWTALPVVPMRDDEVAEFFFQDLTEEDEDITVSLLGGLYLGDFSESGDLANASALPLPNGLVDAFGELTDVEVVSRDGGETRLRGVRHVPEGVAEAADGPLPDGVFEIVLDADFLPKAVKLTVEGENTTHTNELRFADWGADITVAEPDNVDETPWVDEEALADVQETIPTMLWPTALPDGLVVNQVYAITEEDALEGCSELGISYGPPLDDEEAQEEWLDSDDFLDVYLLSLECALDYDDTPFEPGDFGDVPSREVDDLVEVQVGDTVLQFATTYEDDLAAMIASVQPFDPAAEIERLHEEGASFPI